jgi:opacity protein-like surface antigen
MKNKVSSKLLGCAVLLTTLTLTSVSAVQANEITQAQAEITPARQMRTGLKGNYVGGGAGIGTSLDDGVTDSNFDGNVQGRFAMPQVRQRNLPFSVRGSLLFDGDNVVAIPSVTYDLAVNDRANVYAGLGYSLVGGDDELTSLGDKNSLVINGGFESDIRDNFLGYTDLKLGTDSYDNDEGIAVSVQAGLGYRF